MNGLSLRINFSDEDCKLLNELTAREASLPRYFEQADCLVWDDEIPESFLRDRAVVVLDFLRLLSCRADLMQNGDSSQSQFWVSMKLRCPDWPGFIDDRILNSHSQTLKIFREIYFASSEDIF